jgi:hypothetical protein
VTDPTLGPAAAVAVTADGGLDEQSAEGLTALVVPTVVALV